jgi:hypothetical protein
MVQKSLGGGAESSSFDADSKQATVHHITSHHSAMGFYVSVKALICPACFCVHVYTTCQQNGHSVTLRKEVQLG